jgi:hypothetical protein
MNCAVAVRRRLDNIREYNYIQGSSNTILVTNRKYKFIFGVDQGLMIREELPPEYIFVKHPNLPSLFEYTEGPPASARFMSTMEMSHEQHKTLGLMLGRDRMYNNYYVAKILPVSRRKTTFLKMMREDKHNEG